jgi:hypothetical protein
VEVFDPASTRVATSPYSQPQVKKNNFSEEYGLRDCTAVFGERPTFRRNTSPSSGSKSKPNKKSAEASGKLALLFDPEDGSDIFLQSVGTLSELHGVTTQKTVLPIVTAIIISNPT